MLCRFYVCILALNDKHLTGNCYYNRFFSIDRNGVVVSVTKSKGRATLVTLSYKIDYIKQFVFLLDSMRVSDVHAGVFHNRMTSGRFSSPPLTFFRRSAQTQSFLHSKLIG